MLRRASLFVPLERAGFDPRFSTLDRVLLAAGLRLELVAERRPPGLDAARLAEQLAMSPAERVAAFESLYGAASALLQDLTPAEPPA